MSKCKKIKQIFDPKMIFYDFVKFTLALPVVIDLRIKKIFAGQKKHIFRGRYILSSNHISYEDPVILSATFWKRRVGFVATSDLFSKKIWNWFFRNVGCIPIDKENPSLQTFKAVSRFIDRGHVVGVFPEGTVSSTSNMNTFKSGIVIMSILSDADILPVYIVKRKNRLQRQVVVIGEKIKCSKYIKGDYPTMDEIQLLTNILAEKEKELSNLYKKGDKK